MSKIGQFRRNADACEAYAAAIASAHMKLKWLDLAQEWREIANRLEFIVKAVVDREQDDQRPQNDS
jgi:hypothetical protein